jgi:hypothetical protein
LKEADILISNLRKVGESRPAGRLRFSNLIIYDRQTGFVRSYGRNPYSGYELFDTCTFGPSRRPCLAIYEAAAQAEAKS